MERGAKALSRALYLPRRKECAAQIVRRNNYQLLQPRNLELLLEGNIASRTKHEWNALQSVFTAPKFNATVGDALRPSELPPTHVKHPLPQPPRRSSAQVPIPRPLSSLLTPRHRLRLCGGGGQDLVRRDMVDSRSSPAASQLSMARSCHSSASCATPRHRVSPKLSPSSPAATREHVADGGRSRRIQEKIGGLEKNRGHRG
jgi:hypothetical protein